MKERALPLSSGKFPLCITEGYSCNSGYSWNSERVQKTCLRVVPLKNEETGVFIRHLLSVIGYNGLVGKGEAMETEHPCMDTLELLQEQIGSKVSQRESLGKELPT